MIQLNENIDSTGEVNELIKIIYTSDENSEYAILYKKMLIVLLVTKLQVFIENQTSNWFKEKKKSKNSTVKALSREIVAAIIKDTYHQIDINNISRNKNIFKNFNILHNDNYPLEDIEIDFKITISNQGSNEVEKVLKKIGIDNFFEKIHDERTFDDEINLFEIKRTYDYKGNLDKLFNYRNQAVHDDKTPPCSQSDINEFIETINVICANILDYIASIR